MLRNVQSVRILWLVVATIFLVIAIAESLTWSRDWFRSALGMSLGWTGLVHGVLAIAIALLVGVQRMTLRIVCTTLLWIFLAYYSLYLVIGPEGWWVYRWIYPITMFVVCVFSLVAHREASP